MSLIHNDILKTGAEFLLEYLSQSMHKYMSW